MCHISSMQSSTTLKGQKFTQVEPRERSVIWKLQHNSRHTTEVLKEAIAGVQAMMKLGESALARRAGGDLILQTHFDESF